jgi:hypothetical protein
MITEAEALEIAREAIRGKVEHQAGSSVTVVRQGANYVVTFVHHTPADMLGPDYDARVTIDGQSGEVRQSLGAP